MSTTAMMTGRERFTRMLERRDQDRVPRFDQFWPETLDRWRSEGMDKDWADQQVLDWMRADVDMAWGLMVVPFPGQRDILEEDDETQLIRDANGQVSRWWKNKFGTPEHVSFGCTDPDIWNSTYKPALIKNGHGADLKVSKEQIDKAHAKGLFATMGQPDLFESVRQLVGDEVVLMSVLTEQEWVRDMATTYADIYIAGWDAVWDAGGHFDAAWIFGDIGFRNGPFFSPAVYRDLFWPQHVRMVEWAHDRGIKLLYHTDGDVKCFIDMFIEGGFDVYQPIEAKAGMDVRELVPKYGDQLSFWGNINMALVSEGDRDAIEHEVVSKLKVGMTKKCYAYHSDHSVPPGVSWEDYQFIIQLLDEHGNYE